MSVLDRLPASAGLDETAAACLEELERSALGRGLFGAGDLALIETLRGVVADYQRAAAVLVGLLDECGEDNLGGDSPPFPGVSRPDFQAQNRGDSPPKIEGNPASKSGGMPLEKGGEYGVGSG